MEINYRNVINRNAVLSGLSDAEIYQLDDKLVAITGGAGSIGGQVANNLLKYTKAQVLLLDNDESRLHTFYMRLNSEERARCRFKLMDIRDKNSVDIGLDQEEISYMIHAAALKHVPVLESHPYEAYQTNVKGTYNVLCSAVEQNIPSFTFISTDKATRPINVLGKTKLIGEHLTAAFQHRFFGNTKRVNFASVRFGNVFLSRGSAIETFIHQMSNNLPITITSTQMERFFMDLDDAANLILKVSVELIQGVTILNMGDPVKIIDVVERLKFLLRSNSEILEIGIKPGEKITEDLISLSESSIVFQDSLIQNLNHRNRLEISSLDLESVTDNITATKKIDEILESLM